MCSFTMRAIVLLCLLKGVFVQADESYTWGGPGGSTDTDPNTANVCLADQSSCGCCLMQQQIHRIRTFFNTSLAELELQLTQTRNILNNVRASRSAFSVALNNDDNLKCFGPFRDDKVVTYSHIFMNLGNGYNQQTGIFTAPRAGTYSLALTAYSDAGSPGNTLAACAALHVNGKSVADLREKNMQDQEDSATVVVAVHLNAGDQVSANLPIGCFLCDNKNHYNTFSGFLLYATN
ncbi:complement C1q-like protein 4 [Takifugu flavidus]|uniref:complement C1q-like protein 4 n=1 Tax=Takifugu flavidus TaxID=433684 RepID=UPI00254407B5|nr:complement C1q-like protein 4 [Takifugu flavidus]